MLKYLSPVRFVEKRSSLKFSELEKNDFLEHVNSSFDYKNVITVDDFSYTKGDLLVLLDEIPDFSEFIRINDLVWQSEDLLYLLEEKGLKAPASLRRIDKVLSLNEFPSALYPYVIDSCKEVLAVALQQNDFYDLSLLVEFIEKYNLDLESNFLEQINAFLDDSIRLFSSLSADNYEEKEVELSPWTNSQWNRFLNILPDNFKEKRSELARQILRFANIVLEKDLTMGKDLYKYLCQVKDVDADVARGIEDMNRLMQNVSMAEGQIEKENSPIRVAISLLLLVFALVKLFRACSSL